MKIVHLHSLLNTTCRSLIEKSRKIEKGSGEPNKTKVATVSSDQVKEIAELKMADLNAADVEAKNAHGCRNCTKHGYHRRIIFIPHLLKEVASQFVSYLKI